jgi:uncharacterized protein YukE
MAMLRVETEHVAAAAASVTGHGEDLAMRHLCCDNRIEAALPGWAGRSATALGDRASHWVSASTAMVTRVGEHATALHTSAVQFAASETRNARALDLPDIEVRPTADPTAGIG